MLVLDFLSLLGHISCALYSAVMLSGTAQIAGLIGSIVGWLFLRKVMHLFWTRALPGRRVRLEASIRVCNQRLAVAEGNLSRANEALTAYESSLRSLGNDLLNALGHAAHIAGTVAGFFVSSLLGQAGATIAQGGGRALTERTRKRDELRKAVDDAASLIRRLQAERSKLSYRRTRLNAPPKPSVSTTRWIVVAASVSIAAGLWATTNVTQIATKPIEPPIDGTDNGVTSTVDRPDQPAKKQNTDASPDFSFGHTDEVSSAAPNSAVSNEKGATKEPLDMETDRGTHPTDDSANGISKSETGPARLEISAPGTKAEKPTPVPPDQRDVASTPGQKPSTGIDSAADTPKNVVHAELTPEQSAGDSLLLHPSPKPAAEPAAVLQSGPKHVAEPGAVLQSGPKHVPEKGASLF